MYVYVCVLLCGKLKTGTGSSSLTSNVFATAAATTAVLCYTRAYPIYLHSHSHAPLLRATLLLRTIIIILHTYTYILSMYRMPYAVWLVLVK